MKVTQFLTFPLLLLGAATAVAEPVENVRRAGPNAESVLENEFGLTSVATGKTLTSLATALVSAQSSMNTRSAVISAYSVFETAAPSSIVASVSKSNFAYITPTAQPSWFSKLPGDVKSVFLSEQSVLRSIETKILKVSSSGPAAPAATVGMMGALAAGALGVVAAL